MRGISTRLMKMAALAGALCLFGLSCSAKAQQPPAPSTDDERPVVSRDRVPAQQTDDPDQDVQPQQQFTLQEETAPVPEPAHPLTKPANGRRSAQLPVEAYAVVPGTRFLVRLEDELNTEKSRRNNRFKVRTLEPLEAGSGIYLPAGAEIVGHISRVESAGIAGLCREIIA
jgi:hypothetical protein